MQTPHTRIALVVTGCKGIDNGVKQAALTANRKGFRVLVYELEQFSNPRELDAVVSYIQGKYKGAMIYGIGLEYGANLLVRHAALSNHYAALVSIGNPMVLETAEKGFSWLWKYTLEKDLIRRRRKKARIEQPISRLYDVDRVEHGLK